jgi:cytochrome P450
MTDLFFLLFQVFDDQLKWMFPSRMAAHKELDQLLDRIDSMIAEKRAAITQNATSDKPDAEKDILTLMLEEEQAGSGKLSNLELRVNYNFHACIILFSFLIVKD